MNRIQFRIWGIGQGILFLEKDSTTQNDSVYLKILLGSICGNPALLSNPGRTAVPIPVSIPPPNQVPQDFKSPKPYFPFCVLPKGPLGKTLGSGDYHRGDVSHTQPFRLCQCSSCVPPPCPRTGSAIEAVLASQISRCERPFPHPLPAGWTSPMSSPSSHTCGCFQRTDRFINLCKV